ncbi:RHS repeat-associated core domain-containing protein [Leptospira yasudae]|uniref:RHS repeat-associated core domain-containing protein n=1 Tax=Leptospira yasudae TaxID=2202201 RepID=UPI0010916CAC|nr:RHS repeat-associated core domain-containing protein [Leptospira yasudae]TGM99704.1 hypothetical protein EHR10_08930 [Leptospira yasudae]
MNFEISVFNNVSEIRKYIALKSKNALVLSLFFAIISGTTMGFFSIFTTNEEASIPFPIPELTIDSLGKASTSIEIPLPPATAEIRPTLSLNYSSGEGTGLLGVGWQLGGLESIVRDPSFGIQLNSNDRYLSTSVGPIVYRAANAPYYFSKRESFHRFEPIFDGTCTGGPCGWIEKTPEGITYFYGVADGSGNDYNSKIKAEGTNTVKIWALSRVRDRHGNGYDIHYLPVSATNQYQPVPEQIIYNQGVVTIDFSYEGRLDAISNYALGGRYRLGTRLNGIEINFQGSEIDQWDLSYTYGSNRQSQLTTISRTNFEPLNLTYTTGNLSFGTGVTHLVKNFAGIDFNAYYKYSDNGKCGGALSTCLMTAVQANPLAALFCAFTIMELSTDCDRGIEKNYTTFVDVSGDERPDFVRLVPAGYQPIDPLIPPSNIVSHALAKLVVNPTIASGTSAQVGDGSFESPSFRYTEVTKILPADVNGDGRMDFYIVEDYNLPLKIAISTGNGFSMVGTDISTLIPRADQKRWFYLRPDQKEYQFAADMNGDGRSDFIQKVGDDLVIYYANGSSVSTGNSNAIPSSVFGTYGQAGQAFLDMDGNGIADFVRFNNIDNVSTRELIVTLLNDDRSLLRESRRGILNYGKDGNGFFVDLNGDSLIDYVSVDQAGSLIAFYFDGRTFLSPYAIGMNGVHYMEDSTQYMNPSIANPYLLDLKRDGGPLDKLIETNMDFDGEEVTLYFHDNSSQFTESVMVIAHLPDTVYQGDAPSSYYDIDKDGQNETIYFHFFFDAFGQQRMALRIHYTSDGYDFEHIINENDLYNASTFEEQPNYPALTNSLYQNWRLTKTFAELNGDGRMDFVWYDGSSIRISYGIQSGDQIQYNSNGDTVIGGASSFSTALDMNRDGKADLIGIDSAMNDIQKRVGFNIAVNSDTVVSMTGNIHVYSKNYTEPIGLLKTIDNGVGEKVHTISYANSYELSGAIPGNASSYPIIPFDSADVLAKSVHSQYGGGETSITCFDYTNHRYYSGNRDNRRNLGFERITSRTSLNYVPSNCSDTSPLRTNERYAIQNGTVETDGIIFRNVEYFKGVRISDERSVFSTVTSPFGMKYSQLNSTVSDSFQNGSLLVTKSIGYVYADQYGNPTTITETIGGNVSTTQVSYMNDLGNWMLSLPLSNRKVTNGLLVQDRIFTYYSNFDISSIQDFFGKPEYAVQSFLIYDSFGNPLSIQDANNQVTTFQYDIVANKFPIRITNPMGQVVLKEYDLSKGLETKITDPNGAETLKSYDKFGRPNEVILPGESSWSQRIIYENTGRASQAIQTLVRDSQNGDVISKEFYDRLGRTTRKETTLDGGKLLVTLSEYNMDGSLKRKSKPFIENFDSIYYMDFVYNGPDGKLNQINHPDGRVEKIIDSGFVKTVTIESGGVEIHKERIVLNELGQTTSKEIQNTQSFSYSYDPAGRLSQITDPAGDISNFYYDLVGRKIRQTDQNSGTIQYSYDAIGNMTRTTDGRGVSLNYTHDSLGRVVSVSGPSPDSLIVYEYDLAPNGIGRVSKVQDTTGETSFEYDIRGNTTKTVKKIEDLTFVERAVYDSLDRVQDYTYPDGSVVHNSYAKGGYLNGVTMDVPDHGSYGFPVVSYEGPTLSGSGEVQISRRTGNGVKTDIIVDPIFKRVKEYKTILPNAFEQESITYDYDPSGNITKITDRNRPDRTQTFLYDGFKRVVEASGKYGTETYQYTQNGNLVRKGSATFQYADPTHTQAITSMNSPSTGTVVYTYDAAGNMTSRKGDALTYNDAGKLVAYQSGSLGNTINRYDYSGSRVKRTEDVKGTVLFSLGGTYEVLRTPGNGDAHTLYVKGASGETVAQFTRDDANLISAIDKPEFNELIANEVKTSKDKLLSGLLLLLIQATKDPGDFNKAILIVFLFVCIGFPIAISGKRVFYSRPKWAVSFAPILLLSFGSFANNCSGLMPGGESGTPPWAIFAAGIPASVPSINSPSASSGGSGGGSAATVPGMYFYHPDHLGSISMLTDGGGNPISGGEMPGSSHVSYKPYGEILRTDSAGPDIFRYKYTGQEEESYTGLYNYGARFYDPEIGRFIQADDVASANVQSGMNRYMYVEGSPTNFVDPSGHNKYIHMFNQIVRHLVGATNKEMISNIKKDIVKSLTESDNPLFSLVGNTYIKAQNRKHLREAKRQQYIATGVAVVISIASFGAGSALVAANYVNLGLAFGVIGTTAGGYAIGSTAGYLVGGTLTGAIRGRGTGAWDDRSALQGAFIGGIIGASIGFSMGMDAWENTLLSKSMKLKNFENYELGETLFGKQGSSKWVFSGIKSYDPGNIKVINYAYGMMSSLMNSKGNSYAATDATLTVVGLITPIPVISYSAFVTIRDHNAKYDKLTFYHRNN